MFEETLFLKEAWLIAVGQCRTCDYREQGKREIEITHSPNTLYGMLEGTPAREGAGRCYRGQCGGLCDG